MNANRAHVVSTMLIAATALLAGCAGTPPTKFYTLNAVAANDVTLPTRATKQALAIGVGPVELPRYLDRPQIVTRASGNEFDVAEFDQWAEPLKDNFSRVLAENLSLMLATDRVIVFPWKRAHKIDYQVTVDVTRFIGTAGGTSSLVARWRVLSGDGKQELLVRRSEFSETASTQDYEATVGAMNATLEELSRQIVAGVRSVARIPGGSATRTNLVKR